MLQYKRSYLAGLVVYLVLLFFSAAFYKERCVFSDSAYYLFFMVKDGSLSIQHYRFGAIVTQILPLLARKLFLSLNSIILLASLNRELFCFACYLLCGAVLRNYKMALVLLLFNTLLVSETFYFQSELTQGIVLLITLFAFLDSEYANKARLLKYLVSFALIIVIVFLHPLVVMPFVFMCAYFYLREQRIKNIPLYFLFFIAVIVFKKLFYVDAYDANGMKYIEEVPRSLEHFFDLDSNKRFLLDCLQKYQWLIVLLVGNTVGLIMLKKWWKLVLFLIFTIGYILLINLSFPGFMISFYLENLYTPLALFLAIPFINDIFPLLHLRRLALASVLIVTCTGLLRIYLHHTPFTRRLIWERKYLSENLDKKQIVNTTKVPEDTLLMRWGAPYEFWMLSTTEYGRTASIVFAEDPANYMDATSQNKTFVTLWGGRYNYDDMPARYFKFKDTVTAYQVIQ
ncbi:MAG: hypothetical protein BGO69_02605 [Bacteroidetes bacterium 46-16]|nr:MAG: hypothetical protein BGO69_02605 [Bacteroidetes bacterium 46-16]